MQQQIEIEGPFISIVSGIFLAADIPRAVEFSGNALLFAHKQVAFC